VLRDADEIGSHATPVPRYSAFDGANTRSEQRSMNVAEARLHEAKNPVKRNRRSKKMDIPIEHRHTEQHAARNVDNRLETERVTSPVLRCPPATRAGAGDPSLC
jgi:hypothetical protein